MIIHFEYVEPPHRGGSTLITLIHAENQVTEFIIPHVV
jgi:hypothetical protein